MSTTPTKSSKPGRYGGKASRYYNVGGKELPSVTTILSVVGKPALVNWSAKVEREHVMRVVMDQIGRLPLIGATLLQTTIEAALGPYANAQELKTAGDIGSAAHARIEWQMKAELGLDAGDVPKLGEESQRAYDAFSRWSREVRLEAEHSETVVHSDKYGYAGTLDLIGWMNAPDEPHVRTVIDFKTGRAVYPEALLQLSAYANAAIEMELSDPLHLNGCVVRLPKTAKDPNFETRLISNVELADLFPVFLSVFDLWRFLDKQ